MAAPRPGVFHWLLSYRPKPESGYSLLPLPRADSDTDAASRAHLTESEPDDSEEMVQTYGASGSQHDPRGEGAGTGESDALLGGAPQAPAKRQGHATLVSCVSNLSNTIIGSGTWATVQHTPLLAD